MVIPEHSILRGNNNIAAHSDLEATHRRNPLHTTNDWHLRFLYRVEKISLSYPVIRECRIIMDSINIYASAERLPGSIQDDDSDLCKMAPMAVLESTDAYRCYLVNIQGVQSIELTGYGTNHCWCKSIVCVGIV